MRLLTLFLASVATTTGLAVEQAAFVWQKHLATTVPSDPAWPKAVLLENGELVTVGLNGESRCVVTFIPSSGVERSYVLPIEGSFTVGALAADRQNRIYVAGQTSKATKLLRLSSTGEVEMQKDLAGEARPFGLLWERSGDLFLASPKTLTRTGATNEPTWSRDPSTPTTHLLTFQSGNVLLGGHNEQGIWLTKFDPAGKELMKVLLPGGPAVITHLALDAASNISVLARSPQGGVKLWSLEGATGLVNWSEDKLDQPTIKPAALVTDPNKFILVGVNSQDESAQRGYVVRYSLGGQAITNFNPAEPTCHLADLVQDVFGEIYVTYTIAGENRTTIHQYRLGNNLVGRYNIRTSISGAFEAKQTLVRSADGAVFIYGLSGDGSGPRHPAILRIHQAPVAKHEAFVVGAGQAFTSPHSVLANDQFVEGATMRVTQLPKEGTLDFRPDGTFTYTPKAGFTGKDTFRYQLSRGSLAWYAAIVTLEVK